MKDIAFFLVLVLKKKNMLFKNFYLSEKVLSVVQLLVIKSF